MAVASKVDAVSQVFRALAGDELEETELDQLSVLASTADQDLVSWLQTEGVLTANASQLLGQIVRGYVQMVPLDALLRPGGMTHLRELLGGGEPASDAGGAPAQPTRGPEPDNPFLEDEPEATEAPAAPLEELVSTPVVPPPPPPTDNGASPESGNFEAPAFAPTAAVPPPEEDGAIQAPQVGDTLGRCLLTDELGRGATSIVFRALHQSLKVTVAVKVLIDRGGRIAEFSHGEPELLARLSHPNILRILDFEPDQRPPYLVLEFLDGQTVADVIAQSGSLRPFRALEIVKQTAEALKHALDIGVLHCDLKPANLLLARDGSVRMADLGLARMLGGSETDERGNMILGTPAYIAPERVNNDIGVDDHRADIYSLGVSLYQMLSGRLPFTAGSSLALMLKHVEEEPRPLGFLMPDLDPDLCGLVSRMMAKDPAQRYQSYDELLHDLRPLLELETESFRNPDGQSTARRRRETTSREAGRSTSRRKQSGIWSAVTNLIGKNKAEHDDDDDVATV